MKLAEKPAETVFSPRQKRIFLMCFLSYTVAYIARLNMSAALDNLIDSLSLTKAQGGMFQTIFALVYAAGQLVNGSIIDRVSARRYLAVGLVSSAACNLAFGLTSSYSALLVIWGLNGAAQSMLWTPIVKLMAVWFKGKRRSRASFGISMTLILGNFSAWALSGFMAAWIGWRLSFIIPAALAAVMGVLAGLLVIDEPASDELSGSEQGQAAPSGAPAPKTAMPLGLMLITTGLIQVLICCVCNGFVRDGIIAWGPTILAAGGEGGVNSTLYSLLIPLLNLIGVLCAKRIHTLMGENARRCVAYLMGVSAVLALLLLPLSRWTIGCALCLGLCCSATYGINPMLTTLIPMEYEPVGRVGLVAGVVDCFIYLGSSLAGVVTGAISDAAGWNVVYLIWCGVALMSMAFAFMSVRGGKSLARQ